MREAKYPKAITIALSPEVYSEIKEITDRQRISMAEWFRSAADKALSDGELREEKDESHHREEKP